jgi:hypothetical protein
MIALSRSDSILYEARYPGEKDRAVAKLCMSILVVDDLRLFDSAVQGVEVVYAVSSAEALALLIRDAELFTEIWLDHDLGGDDTVLPVVNWIEEDYHNARRLHGLTAVRILTNNPVGFQKIRALERYVAIGSTPQHIGIRKEPPTS